MVSLVFCYATAKYAFLGFAPLIPRTQIGRFLFIWCFSVPPFLPPSIPFCTLLMSLLPSVSYILIECKNHQRWCHSCASPWVVKSSIPPETSLEAHIWTWADAYGLLRTWFSLSISNSLLGFKETGIYVHKINQGISSFPESGNKLLSTGGLGWGLALGSSLLLWCCVGILTPQNNHDLEIWLIGGISLELYPR